MVRRYGARGLGRGRAVCTDSIFLSLSLKSTVWRATRTRVGLGSGALGGVGEAEPVAGHVDFSFLTEPASKNEDDDEEDEEDYPNEGYL